MREILRYSAFTADGKGGNPAGVVLDARGMDDSAMQRIAADLGYSETAFILPRPDGEFDIRYFSPLAEVSFCGHATIAAAVAHAERHGAGEKVLHTRAGVVRVDVDAGVDGAFVATLASVEPRMTALDPADLASILDALRWRHQDLDPALPPAVAYAGAWHPVIAAATRARLARLDYDFDALRAMMVARGWTTVNLVWREDATTFHARNPFPTGGVVEDPATGAAAAALGAYLAERNALPPGRAFTIRQGEDMGRPSRIAVAVPADLRDGVRVSGTAVNIPEPPATSIVRGAAAAILAFAALVGSGLVFNEQLAPKATGAPSQTLALQPAQTEIDRELRPLLEANPGKTGALLLSDGLDAFAARAMTAQKAGRSLDLQYYIWNDDLTGHLLAREVHAAAERGVRVRILLDDMNAAGLDPQWMALDAHPRIELRLYNPFRNRAGLERGLELVQRVFSVNHRMHNKAWIADGRVAIIGGRNIGEEYFAADAAINFRDLDLLLFGPAVGQANAIFDEFWNSNAAVPISALNVASAGELRDAIAEIDDEALQAQARPYLDRVAASLTVRDYLQQQLKPVWTDKLQVLSDPPSKRGVDSRQAWLVTPLLDLLRGTRHKALLISPYFVPGEMVTDDLSRLAGGGAAVGVITNSLAANDVPAVHSGYAGYRQELLRNGVRLHEIKLRGRAGSAGPLGSSNASLHTKAFVVDDARGFVGSFNLDPRSAALNTEMGVVFDDPALAAGIRAEYLRLSAPESSYWVYLDPDGDVRWLDREAQPPQAIDTEPDAGVFRRALARTLAWLPIESQL